MRKTMTLVLTIFLLNQIVAKDHLLRIDNNLSTQIYVFINISDCSSQSFRVPGNSKMIFNVLTDSYYDITIKLEYSDRNSLLSESSIPYYQGKKYAGTIIKVQNMYAVNPISDIKVGDVGYPSREENIYGIQQVPCIKVGY